RCQNGEAGAVADAHDEHQPPLHLDDGLGNRSTLEHPRRALGQAGQTRGDRRQLVGPVRREARRGRQGKAVRRNDDRMSDIGYAVGEVSDQPVEFIDLSTHLISCPSLPAPLSALLPPARHVTALPLRTARTFPWVKPGVWCSAPVERCAREARRMLLPPASRDKGDPVPPVATGVTPPSNLRRVDSGLLGLLAGNPRNGCGPGLHSEWVPV